MAVSYSDVPKVYAFTLLEILIVVAIIAIMATLVISFTTGTTQQANEVVARQQQAELQTALGNWVSAVSADPGGLAATRSAYNSATGKLLLLSNYLQPATYARLSNSGNSVTSAALSSAKARLDFSSPWNVGGFPVINWVNTQQP